MRAEQEESTRAQLALSCIYAALLSFGVAAAGVAWPPLLSAAACALAWFAFRPCWLWWLRPLALPLPRDWRGCFLRSESEAEAAGAGAESDEGAAEADADDAEEAAASPAGVGAPAAAAAAGWRPRR